MTLGSSDYSAYVPFSLCLASLFSKPLPKVWLGQTELGQIDYLFMAECGFTPDHMIHSDPYYIPVILPRSENMSPFTGIVNETE